MNSAGIAESGERADPTAGQALTHQDLRHLQRYRWARPRVSGRVLDAACGSGYGSALLAAAGCEVAGLDADQDAVELALSRNPGADFRHWALPTIPWPDGAFDAVVSFETVEHVEDDARFVAEIRRVLKPGGTLLLSTPNKEVTSPHGPPTNPWHVREYRLPELRRLLDPFAELETWMQDPGPRRTAERLARRTVARYPALCRPGRWWDRLAHGDGAVERWDASSVPRFWVFQARR